MSLNEIWCRSATGRVVNLFNPRPGQIHLDDIVRNLARITRYNAGIKWPDVTTEPLHYSVAEHCVHLARYALDADEDNPAFALQLLMHDCAEAYMGDMIRPLKDAIPDFSKYENRLTKFIYEQFGISYPWGQNLGHLDSCILLDEQEQGLEIRERKFEVEGCEPLGITLQFWRPQQAYREFFLTWGDLWQRMERLQAENRMVVG